MDRMSCMVERLRNWKNRLDFEQPVHGADILTTKFRPISQHRDAKISTKIPYTLRRCRSNECSFSSVVDLISEFTSYIVHYSN